MSGSPDARDQAGMLDQRRGAGFDHLTQLLLKGADHAPGGVYAVGGRWSINATEENNATLIAAAHEYMHQVVNEFNPFGQLLNALGIVAQLGDERALTLVLKLLEQCRTAHEAYATFTSVVISGTPPERALANYPDYDVYYKSAAHLAGELDPSASLIAYHIVEVALSECFSAPLPAGIFAGGLSSFLPRDIPPDHRPDKRFKILRDLLPPLVPQMLHRADTFFLDVPGASGLGPSAGWGRTALDAHPGIEEELAELLRTEIRSALRERNVPVLSSEEDLFAGFALLKDAMRRQLPDNPEILSITGETDRGEWGSIAESVTFGEQLVFRRPSRHVNVTSDVDSWAGNVRAREVESLVALVATPARLLEQYEIQSFDWDRDQHGRNVVWLMDPSPGQEQLSGLWTRTYEELDRALRRLPGLMIAVVVMASTIPEEEWWESWGERLQERGNVVLYGDINLVQMLRQARLDDREVTYSVFRIAELEYVSGIVLDADLGGFPLLWLGSGVARAILVRLLRREGGAKVEPSDSLIDDEAIQITLRYIVNCESTTGLFQGSAPR